MQPISGVVARSVIFFPFPFLRGALNTGNCYTTELKIQHYPFTVAYWDAKVKSFYSLFSFLSVLVIRGVLGFFFFM